MHVLYFHLKKLMEPPFSEYLVLLKNRVTFSYSFILNFFVFYGEALRIFFLKLINIIKKQNNSNFKLFLGLSTH
jgi:hypothetical protein